MALIECGGSGIDGVHRRRWRAIGESSRCGQPHSDRRRLLCGAGLAVQVWLRTLCCVWSECSASFIRCSTRTVTPFSLIALHSMASGDWFRTYPLVQHEFELQLSRSVNTLSSTGVQLFVSSVMSFGHDDDGSYQMRVLVQSADFIELEASSVVTGPVAVTVVAEETDGCLVESSFICAQVFTVTIPSDINCTLIRTSEIIDFSGTFQIAFTPKCRDNVDAAACNAFLEDLDESGDVVLDVDWNFVDETCGVDLFEVDFGANLEFYGDDQFSEAVEDDNAYVVDQDTIYGQVELDLPATDAFYDLVDVEIENVFVCTAEVGWDLSATLDALGGLGGCLHSEVVSYYTVIGSGANAEFEGSTDYQVAEENIARFSFSADKMAFGVLCAESLSVLFVCDCRHCARWTNALCIAVDDQILSELRSMSTCSCC